MIRYWESEIFHSIFFVLGDVRKHGHQKRFLDLGANIGFFSLYSAMLGHKTTAIEMLDYNIELYKESIEANHILVKDFKERINLVQAAIAEKDDSEPLCQQKGFKTNESNGRLEKVKNGTSCHKMVQPVSLNKLIVDGTIDPGEEGYYAIKIDIEGYEPYAVMGGSKIFLDEKKRPCYIIIEVGVSENADTRVGSPLMKMMYSFLEQGYKHGPTKFGLDEKKRPERKFEDGNYLLWLEEDRCVPLGRSQGESAIHRADLRWVK
eukprot:TRINITY_DN5901_c0_g1_i4.p1 TRINITY_DN5901_c0_g1~~TRINITY_DN5901_c0_g1_i4.p1  ORF type:complete len:263 (-),score=63.44 TRINITY_DN5901_c0_g1_i4:109-897(-)